MLMKMREAASFVQELQATVGEPLRYRQSTIDRCDATSMNWMDGGC
jgi:hypothetical protein